ncbi:Hypothetical predicted protein [Cloeon dipterum]|uniref:Nuclear receptor domain-containing protein n=1 Tax=Cloeon dipterum TaxID=197152 RepID=A0A8S1DWR7_9INSE|nr:Hypothetical predicted protein [Cloeon dipterum]
MNQTCRVCGEAAAGYHFGAFTCEGCKSFFGRTYNNLSSISDCKNSNQCVINRKNRTSCKACRLRKCLMVGMSKSGSRYGRRSNWFKIHCLLQEQNGNNNNNNSAAAAAALQAGVLYQNAMIHHSFLGSAGGGHKQLKQGSVEDVRSTPDSMLDDGFYCKSVSPPNSEKESLSPPDSEKESVSPLFPNNIIFSPFLKPAVAADLGVFGRLPLLSSLAATREASAENQQQDEPIDLSVKTQPSALKQAPLDLSK